jgi:hypothetical protein
LDLTTFSNLKTAHFLPQGLKDSASNYPSRYPRAKLVCTSYIYGHMKKAYTLASLPVGHLAGIIFE